MSRRAAGVPDYLREAFLFRWNLLFFLGGAAAAALTPVAGVLLPLVAAGELTYLTGLISIPRFRAAIDAKVHAEGKSGGPATPQAPPPSLLQMLAGLPPPARKRFEALHARCVEMRGIAAGVRGATGAPGAAEEIRTPGLDRLLWLFLRLLLSKTALDRFLQTMNDQEITARVTELRKNLASAQAAGDDRVVRSLQDSVAMGELRLENYNRAKKNGDFVSVELDRIEGKIQALTSQGKLQGWIVASLPLWIGLFFNWYRPDLTEPMFENAYGYILITLILLLEATGFVLIRRIVAIDV